MKSLQELAENAINIRSADPEVRQHEREDQAASYERLLDCLDPCERMEKVIDTGHFLLWLPPERLAVLVTQLTEDPLDLRVGRVMEKLVRSAIHNGATSALTTILESAKGGPHWLDIGEIGPWDDALVDLFEAYPHVVELRFSPCIEWKPNLSWQGYLKLLLLTSADSREESITKLHEFNWGGLSWLFYLIMAGKISDGTLSLATKERVLVNILISSKSRYRSCPVLNTFIRSHTCEEMRALFQRVHPDIAGHPVWINARARACQVITNQLPPLSE
ncbi:hypothetical protein [Geopseudomonas aromaticivorans]